MYGFAFVLVSRPIHISEQARRYWSVSAMLSRATRNHGPYVGLGDAVGEGEGDGVGETEGDGVGDGVRSGVGTENVSSAAANPGAVSGPPM